MKNNCLSIEEIEEIIDLVKSKTRNYHVQFGLEQAKKKLRKKVEEEK